MNTDPRTDDLIKRVKKLEGAVFGAKNIKLIKDETFSGPSGGARLLLGEGFFDTPRVVNEVKVELEKRNFYYKRPVIQTALNRLSTARGALTTMTKDGQKSYVKRR